jgi:transketolase
MSALVPLAEPTQAAATSMRDGFGQGIIEAGRQNRDVMVLCGDLRESLKVEAFARAFPAQYIEVGVAEQNMIGIAAGLALAGKIPFAAGYAAFSPGRTWDQLRVSVAYTDAHVILVGSHAGLNVGADGATHQALEDVAACRVIPNLTVVVPSDAEEARKAVHALVSHSGPAYLRLSREAMPPVTVTDTPFTLGTANRLREGSDVTLCANGPLVYEALSAATLAAKEGISCEVLAVHTVKPLDETGILASVRKTGAVVTAEDAMINGGLGGAIAELLSEHYPAPLRRVGVRDRFGQSGTSPELFREYGLLATDILTAIRQVLRYHV